MCCKQRSYAILKFFRCNTYKKRGGGTLARILAVVPESRELDMQKGFLVGVILAAAAFGTLALGPGNSSPATAPTDQTAILVAAGAIADCRDLPGAEPLAT